MDGCKQIALSSLGTPIQYQKSGAIYLWAKLPESVTRGLGMDDVMFVRRLVMEHKVCIIPGSACGSPGYVRVAFANLKPNQCEIACERLASGIRRIVG